MTTAFISYSAKDEKLATQLHSLMSMAGIPTFLAGLSLEPGDTWSEKILESLDAADWVFFLASPNSVKSPAVQQELGASIIQKKTIIPILIDIGPENLPAWMQEYQAIDPKNSPDMLKAVIEKVADQIKVDKFWAGIIVGALVVALLVALARS